MTVYVQHMCPSAITGKKNMSQSSKNIRNFNKSSKIPISFSFWTSKSWQSFNVPKR